MLCQKSKDPWVPDVGPYPEAPRESSAGNPMPVIGEMRKSASGGEWMRVAGHGRRGVKGDWSNKYGAKSKGGHGGPQRPKIMGWNV